jgi:hypothetical protein
MINANDPFFPTEVGYDQGIRQQEHQTGNTTGHNMGMSIRAEIAKCAMAALIPEFVANTNDLRADIVAQMAVFYADALIAELNK